MHPHHGRRVTLALSALMFAVIGIGTTGNCSPAKPSATVEQFYTKYLEVHKSGGLPTQQELTTIRTFLSKRLYALLIDALTYQAEWRKSHPDKPATGGAPPVRYKPPFVDGEYFASNFEGLRRFSIITTTPLSDGRWRVVVHFWYEAGSQGWEDSVVVIREDGRYVIDDVVFSGRGAFSPSGRLTELLRRRPLE